MARIKVEIVYAGFHDQRLMVVEVDEGASIGMAICHSGILDFFPEIDLSKQIVGIFSKPRSLSDLLNEGDRIEIYRPLTIDPKESRRAKAKERARN